MLHSLQLSPVSEKANVAVSAEKHEELRYGVLLKHNCKEHSIESDQCMMPEAIL